MKKRIWIPIVILVLLAAFELTMEQRYSIDSVEPTDTTRSYSPPCWAFSCSATCRMCTASWAISSSAAWRA